MDMHVRHGANRGDLTTLGWVCFEIPREVRCLRSESSECDRRLLQRRCPHWIPPSIIYLPSDKVLSEAYTIVQLSLAYATIKPRLSRYRLAGWVYDRVIDCEAPVLNADGSPLNLDDFADQVNEEFGDESWAGDFLSAKLRAIKQKPAKRILFRYRALWLALACANAKLANEVIS